MNALTKTEPAVPSLAMNEAELIAVLQSSLYPGAKPESIKLVVGYCRALGVDPMQRPVHIVPMSVKTETGYEKRDVIMRGIGLYRTQAARTGEYAGCTEPEFGPTKTLKVNDASVEYPEWCRVTVRRIVSGQVVEFTAKEFWLENYATKGNDSRVPNAMWQKRPFGQIAKCAEAQALRKAFPELGSEPTADEMAGKVIDNDAIEGTVTARTVEQPTVAAEPKTAEQAPEGASPGASAGDARSPASAVPDKPMTDGQRRILIAKAKNVALTETDLVAKFGASAEWKFGQFQAIQSWIAEGGKNG